MRTFDVWRSDVPGYLTTRMDAPTAEQAAREHAQSRDLPDNSQVTVRELSGDRERRVFRVKVVVEVTASATEETSAG